VTVDLSPILRSIDDEREGKSTLIIAAKAGGFEDQDAAALDAGCDGYLRKPFREEDLFEMLREYLGVRFQYTEEEAPVPAVKGVRKPWRRESSEHLKRLFPEGDGHSPLQQPAAFPDRPLILRKCTFMAGRTFLLSVICLSMFWSGANHCYVCSRD
jgi:hypothetical protein